jgi:hypothetical protein
MVKFKGKEIFATLQVFNSSVLNLPKVNGTGHKTIHIGAGGEISIHGMW